MDIKICSAVHLIRFYHAEFFKGYNGLTSYQYATFKQKNVL